MPNRDSKAHSPDASYDEVAEEIDLETSLAEEYKREGWSKVDSPEGGKPAPASTWGSYT